MPGDTSRGLIGTNIVPALNERLLPEIGGVRFYARPNPGGSFGGPGGVFLSTGNSAACRYCYPS